MSQLIPLLLFLVWCGVLFWRRSVSQRRRWLKRLNLPGTWRWQDGDSTLSLSGELATGSFLLREEGLQCSGRWRLLGHRLELHPVRGELELTPSSPYVFDLRLFELGSLGLDGPGRERRVYARGTENVVPLRADQSER